MESKSNHEGHRGSQSKGLEGNDSFSTLPEFGMNPIIGFALTLFLGVLCGEALFPGFGVRRFKNDLAE
jgi:hypothetical protein